MREIVITAIRDTLRATEPNMKLTAIETQEMKIFAGVLADSLKDRGILNKIEIKKLRERLRTLEQQLDSPQHKLERNQNAN